jgi:hypothetical protein
MPVKKMHRRSHFLGHFTASGSGENCIGKDAHASRFVPNTVSPQPEQNVRDKSFDGCEKLDTLPLATVTCSASHAVADNIEVP